MKKILKNIYKTIFLCLWTYLYLLGTSILFIYFWNFNILSGANWQVVYQYWESGGVIHTWKDYLLLGLLISYIPVWYIGWKHFRQIEWIHILLWPITKYNQYIIGKYGSDAPHIVLKNMGTGDIKIEEEIERKSKPKSKIETDAEVNSIRAEVAKKINSVKHE